MQNSWMKTHIVAPIPGKDYPHTWNEFLDWFGTEQACLAYLEKLRWAGEFVCPSCGSIAEAYRASRTRLMCRDCQRQSTVTSGTIFDKTRTPLRVWLAAAWYLTNQKQGVSALGLQRVLGLGSYQTAWTMLHRFRCAMIRQRWILGTHHGSVQPEHLDAYLDEFVFRFNRRTSSRAECCSTDYCSRPSPHPL